MLPRVLVIKPRHSPALLLPPELSLLFLGLAPSTQASWLGPSAFCTGPGCQVGPPGDKASLEREP